MADLPVLVLPPGARHALPDARHADAERLAREVRAASQSPVVGALLESVDAILVVVNAERQIVAVNDRARRLRGDEEVIGRRLGEALECVQAQRSRGGCGTSEACATCGALGAMLTADRTGRPTEAECLLRTTIDPALELNVRATPLAVEGEPFTVVSLRDVSAEKRKQVLEQVFLHDVLNTIAGLRGWADRLRRPEPDVARAAERIDFLSRQLEREVRDHRALMLAESGALVPEIVAVAAAAVLADVERVFSQHSAARGRRLEIAPSDAGLELRTDPALLLRVLVNMVANAFEATTEGGVVRVGCRHEPTGDVCFSVHNAGVIVSDVQARIFHRSFSTKAARGRGIGTYSMKLIGERYLGGKVSFTSSEGDGTAFEIRLPSRPS